LHTAAAAMNLLALEYMFIDNPARDIFIGGYPQPVNGTLNAPEGAGLGLELDHDLIARYSVV
jgi:L-alanine-DL-glutamate epimerase-like enolase superfamily enzyme